MKNRITDLLKIEYPIIQAGMVWCSGWELAAAVSNAGGLGIIGAGSMSPDILREHIQKCKAATDKPFGVNLPLLYAQIEDNINILIEEQVPVAFTSAGNPKAWTPKLKEAGITVIHVIANTKFAKKCEEAGVDAIVAEGFEAGGHNGREETTTLCLIPLIKEAVSIPVIAAGGIGSGKAMLACFALGAEGVQIGSRFIMTTEASAHQNFKDLLLTLGEGSTELSLKQLVSVRLIKNGFYNQVKDAESKGARAEELRELLGKGRARKGMFEGQLEEGELEVGQVVAGIDNIMPAGEVVKEIWEEFLATRELI